MAGLPPWARSFVVIDVETTGLSPYYDRIIELGFAKFVDGVCVRSGDYFVSPEGRTISEKITQITGITAEMVHDAPPFWSVYNEVALNFYDALPVGYHGSFDKSFLMHGLARSWPRSAFRSLPPCVDPQQRWLDVWPLVMLHSPTMKRHKLHQAADYWGVDLPHAHRADADCIATGQILLNIIRDMDWGCVNPEPGRGGLVSWDDLQGVFDAAQWAAADVKRKHFFGRQRDLSPDVKAWLPKGEPIQIYECDLCYAMSPGAYTKNGWTPPERWCINASGVMTCGPACDLVRMWNDGSSGTDWMSRGVQRR